MTNDGEQRHNFEKVDSPPAVDWIDFFPSETKGDGKIRPNNLSTGSAQGKGSFIQKVYCRICGFPSDAARQDHSGGSLDGNGGNYLANTGTASYVFSNGVTHTERYGTPGTRNGGGCSLCGSRNYTAQRTLPTGGNPWDRLRNTGF